MDVDTDDQVSKESSELTDSEDKSDEEFHPLMNAVILRNIFEYCCVRELKKCRLVCSFWHELASPYLQQKSQVVLQEDLFREGNSINSFLSYIDNLDGGADRTFFRNFKVTLVLLDKNNESAKRFWELMGPTMCQLEMGWCRFVGIKMVRNVMFHWTPKLNHLCLRDCTFYKDVEGSFIVENETAEVDVSHPANRYMTSLEFYGGEARSGTPLTWFEVLSSFPNLKQLLINNLNPQGVTDILTEMNRIRRIDSNKLNIEKLNIFNGDFTFGELTAPLAELLVDLKLPIKQLNMDAGMNTSELILASILKTYRTTLRHLSLYRGPTAKPFISFPFDVTFTNLLSLELAETITEDLNFIMYTPKLLKLSICDSSVSEPPILPTAIIMSTEPFLKHSSLPVHLRTFRMDYDCSLGDVKKLVRWFPQIKSLKMYLDDDSFRLICGEWKDLEELEILGDKVTDQGITGLRLTSVDSQFVLTKNFLSISSLKYLRVFIMKNYGISTSISDLSVHHGFLHMNRLYHLEICSEFITEDGWRRLYLMPNLTILKPSDGSWSISSSCFEKGPDVLVKSPTGFEIHYSLPSN